MRHTGQNRPGQLIVSLISLWLALPLPALNVPAISVPGAGSLGTFSRPR